MSSKGTPVVRPLADPPRGVGDGRVTYTYRVFIETEDATTDAMHYASERLYEGAIFRVNKPGTGFST